MKVRPRAPRYLTFRHRSISLTSRTWSRIMSKETATAELTGWQERTCSLCLSVYRYRVAAKETGKGATGSEARANAEKAVRKTLKHTAEIRPCPNCGLIQP